MAATIEIRIEDASGSGAGGAGGPPGDGGGGTGGGGGGYRGRTPREALRAARERRLGRDDDGNFNNPLAVGQLQRRQRLNRLRRAGRNREATAKRSERDELTLIRVQRAAEKKLEAQRAKRERQQEQDRKRRERKQEQDRNRREREAAAAERARQQRNAQYAQVAVTAAKGGPSALENAGSAAGAIVGGALGGPAGAIVGEMVGAEIGAKIQNPFKRLTDVLDFTTKGMQVVGQAAIKIAGNDGIGALTGVANEVAAGLEDIPVVGKLASSSIRVLTTGLETLTSVVGAFNDRGRQLAGYNGVIAAATAEQDVARVLSDIREAQQVDYGPLIKKQTEFEEVMKAILLPIKQEIVIVLPKLLDILLDVLEKMTQASSSLFSDSETLRKIANGVAQARADAARERAGVPDPLHNWLFGVPVPAGPLPMPVPAPRPVRVPILGAP